MPLPCGLLCATSPSRVVWRSRARVCLMLSPFTLFLSLPIHSPTLPRSLSLSPIRHGRAAELLRHSLLHCLDIIEPPSTASASASGASTASPTLAAPPFAVRRSSCHCRHNSRRRGMPPHTWPGGPRDTAGRAVGQARPRLRPAESSPPLPALSAEPGRSKL